MRKLDRIYGIYRINKLRQKNAKTDFLAAKERKVPKERGKCFFAWSLRCSLASGRSPNGPNRKGRAGQLLRSSKMRQERVAAEVAERNTWCNSDPGAKRQ